MSVRAAWKNAIDRILHRASRRAEDSGVAVLAVTRSEADRQYLESLAAREGWRLTVAPDCAHAAAILGEREVAVILCDRDLPDRNWRGSIKTLLAAVIPPCVVLTSPVNDSYLWQEVVQHGGYDVLTRPFHDAEVISVVRRAWIFWKAGRAAGKP